MLIGVGRITLDFYNNPKASLKSAQLDDLCNGLRKKFNISIMEVAEFTDPEKCVIGFAMVFPETWNAKTAQTMTEKICETIDSTSFARVTIEDCDLLQHGGVD